MSVFINKEIDYLIYDLFTSDIDRDRAKFFVHMLTRRYRPKKREDLYNYVNLKSSWLKNIMGKKYAQIIRLLNEAGIVETNPSYAPDRFTMSYRLTDEYIRKAGSWFGYFDQNQGPSVLLQRYQKEQAYSDELTEEEVEIRGYLESMLPELSINTSSAVAHCVDLINQEYNLFPSTRIYLSQSSGYRVNCYTQVLEEITLILQNKGVSTDLEFSSGTHYTYAKFNWDMYSIIEISEARWNTKADKYRRFHSCFTSLRKELRGYVSLNGESLVGIDIRNSQPLILAMLLKKNYPTPNSDVKMYINQCEMGNLYEYIAKQYIELTGDKRSVDVLRAEIKEGLFKYVVFCSLPTQETSELGKVFRTVFPSVFDFLIRKKTSHSGNKNKYKEVSRELQRIEGGVIIDTVVRRLRDEVRDIKLYTIHDSIFTTPKHIEQVRLALYDVLKTQYDISPSMKEEWLVLDKRKQVFNHRQSKRVANSFGRRGFLQKRSHIT